MPCALCDVLLCQHDKSSSVKRFLSLLFNFRAAYFVAAVVVGVVVVLLDGFNGLNG